MKRTIAYNEIRAKKAQDDDLIADLARMTSPTCALLVMLRYPQDCAVDKNSKK